ALVATIPMSRHDLEREVDLIEEIARLNGYDNIPVTMPVSRVVRRAKDQRQLMTCALRDAMVTQGFSEIINYSFTSPSAWNKINLSDDDARRNTIKVLNPLTEEQSIMRTSLVPAMLETVARNLSYRSNDLSLFELRPVFAVQDEEVQPIESLRLCAAITGKREIEGWSQSDSDVDYYDLKGTVESVCQQLNISALRAELDGQQPYLHPGKSCRLYHDKILLGVMGEIHPQVQENYDIDQPVYLVELDVAALQTTKKIEKSFKPISRFPDSYRDSAFLVDEDVSAQQLFEILAKVKVKNLDDVTLFDMYSGKGVPEGKKSLAIRVRYRSMDKTFTDDEINAMHAKIVKSLQKNLGAEIR
ncbi:MAG: phenylalanine--tRNA ligase subunit beta, partial [Deltaproteobacteria bacterium]|nr:phenylalanine--tRNA ligase subunit beta [Deltaproteobacteria bacterium]